MPLKRKLFMELRERLPRTFFSTPLSYLLLDHIQPSLYMDDWSSLPFNGQIRRMSMIAAISRSISASAVIETGTFKGSSTPYLASLFKCKTYTIEINEFHASCSERRFKQNHKNLDIELRIGDSAVEIVNVLKEISSSETVAAYLDAHWLSAIPTKQELESLIDWGGKWVAIIDDFEIEHDSGYKYDSYGDVVIGMPIIPKNDELEVWLPREDSLFETSVRSGTAYVFSNKDLREMIPTQILNDLIRVI